MSKINEIQPMVPVVRRPAFWSFLSAAVAFGAIFYLEGRIDPNQLLLVVQALLALIGVGAGARTAWHAYRNYVVTQAGLED